MVNDRYTKALIRLHNRAEGMYGIMRAIRESYEANELTRQDVIDTLEAFYNGVFPNPQFSNRSRAIVAAAKLLRE